MKGEPSSRRQVLKITGTGIAAFSGTGIVSATDRGEGAARELQDRYDAWEKAYEQLVREYGKAESNILANISRSEIRKVERNIITEGEALDNIYDRVIKHPNLQEISADVRDYIEWKKPRNERIQESTDKIQKVQDSSGFDDLQTLRSYSLLLGNTEEDSNSSLGPNSSAYTSARPTTVNQTGRMRGVAHVGGVGSADYTIRLYNKNYRFLTGNIQINVTYHARGTTLSGLGSASTEMFAFIREQDGTIVKEYLESLGSSNSERSKSAQFILKEDEFYDIGIELVGSASTVTEVSYSDYFYTHWNNDRRRISHEYLDFEIESLG